MHRQLVTPLRGAGAACFAISCSKDLERDARATLILAPRLFRFDVVVAGDTLRTVVRNLSRADLRVDPGHHNEPGTNIVLGAGARYQPARATAAFALHSATESILVTVTIGTLWRADQGLLRVTAQAIVRQHPASAGLAPEQRAAL